MKLIIKRIYESYDKGDGYRILVDRLWPRGISKVNARIDFWLKDIAPSTELRKWFGHDPEKWPEFKAKYLTELSKNNEMLSKILDLAKNDTVTLLYAAKDEVHNEAVVIKQLIEKNL